MNHFCNRGVPIPGTGAGLRPQGRDHAFLEDFRDTYHISVPIVQDETKIDYFSESYSGNGKTKWPNADLLPANWKAVVSCYSSITMFMKDGLSGKKMQGKSEAAMRTRSFRASKRAPT